MVVEDQRRALGEVELGREREREELGRHRRLGEAAQRAERRHAVARLDRGAGGRAAHDARRPRCRARRAAAVSSGTRRGVCSSSGKETPAACTSISTPSPGVSMCEASGSGSSTSASALSGPVSSTIWMALMAGIMSERGVQGRRAHNRLSGVRPGGSSGTRREARPWRTSSACSTTIRSTATRRLRAGRRPQDRALPRRPDHAHPGGARLQARGAARQRLGRAGPARVPGGAPATRLS